MTTDITLFDNAERMSAAMPADVPRLRVPVKRLPRADAKEAQQKRVRALVREGYTVRDGTGITVFSFGRPSFRYWDGNHEATPKPQQRRLIPGKGFAD
jgi:hypothetical protein